MRIIITRIGLIVTNVLIWLNMYWAKGAEYDMNYGYFINSMLLSIATCILIIVIWFVRRKYIKEVKIDVILFLITGSPISIMIFIYVYQAFNGLYFKM